jgi:hypothetical protein
MYAMGEFFKVVLRLAAALPKKLCLLKQQNSSIALS